MSTEAMPEPLGVADASGDAHVVIEVPGLSCKILAATACTALCDPLATQQVHAPTFLQSSSQSRSTEGSSSTVSRSNSSIASSTVDTPECRICLSAGDAGDLVQPCSCSGTLSYTHTACLSAWVHERGSLVCELCARPYKEPYAQQLETVAAAAKTAKQHPQTSGDSGWFCSRRTCAFLLLFWVAAIAVIAGVVTTLLVLRPSDATPAPEFQDRAVNSFQDHEGHF